MMKHAPAAATRPDVEDAEAILALLAGTLIPDLRSMMKWAGDFDARQRAEPDAFAGLGALNYTIMMVALIGCETLGFYTEGAYKHVDVLGQASAPTNGWRARMRRLLCCASRPRRGTRLPDPGAYLMRFIETYFPNGSDFKKIPKVLADGLRHALVHGFGSLTGYPRVSLGLAVDRDVTKAVWPFKRDGVDAIGMNGVAFGAHFFAAFRRVNDLVESGSDPALIGRMATAARLRLPAGKGVENQFKTGYRTLERHRN